MSSVALIVAMADNGVIGENGQMPWRLPDELRYFRLTTWGKPIVMGRKTYVAIGRPLRGRENIVVSRSLICPPPGCILAHSVEEALLRGSHADEIMVIGGAQLYQAALPLSQRLYLTVIERAFDGDTRFTGWNATEWSQISCKRKTADYKGEALCYRIEQWERRSWLDRRDPD